MPPQIRPATPHDADRLSAIALEAKAHWGYPEEYLEAWSDELTVTPEFIEQHPVACVTVDGEVVGFYALVRADAEWELDHLWVTPASHAHGLGTALLEHALARASRDGATVLKVVSDPNAVGFYHRHGARETGSVPSVPEGRRLPALEIEVSARLQHL